MINLQELPDLTTTHKLVELQIHDVTSLASTKYQYLYKSEHERVSLYTYELEQGSLDDVQNAQVSPLLCRNTLKIDSLFLAVLSLFWSRNFAYLSRKLEALEECGRESSERFAAFLGSCIRILRFPLGSEECVLYKD